MPRPQSTDDLATQHSTKACYHAHVQKNARPWTVHLCAGQVLLGGTMMEGLLAALATCPTNVAGVSAPRGAEPLPQDTTFATLGLVVRKPHKQLCQHALCPRTKIAHISKASGMGRALAWAPYSCEYGRAHRCHRCHRRPGVKRSLACVLGALGRRCTRGLGEFRPLTPKMVP
eukprot:12105024-Alexandrium_andersonii.AAC.1